MRLLAPISLAEMPAFTLLLAAPVSRATWSTMGGEVTAASKLETNDFGPLAPLYWLELAPPTRAGAATVAVASNCLGLATMNPTTRRQARGGTATRMFFRRLRMAR